MMSTGILGILIKHTSSCETCGVDYLDETSHEKSFYGSKAECLDKKNNKREEKQSRILKSLNYLSKEEIGSVNAGGFLRSMLLEYTHGAPEKEENEKRKSLIEYCSQQHVELHGAYRGAVAHRLVISLDKRIRESLVKHGVDPDKVLIDTTKRILNHIKFQNHKGDQLGYAYGLHHDTDNLHCHVLLLNKTKKGKHVAFSGCLKGVKNSNPRNKDVLGEAKSAAAFIELTLYKTLQMHLEDPAIQQRIEEIEQDHRIKNHSKPMLAQAADFSRSRLAFQSIDQMLSNIDTSSKYGKIKKDLDKECKETLEKTKKHLENRSKKQKHASLNNNTIRNLLRYLDTTSRSMQKIADGSRMRKDKKNRQIRDGHNKVVRTVPVHTDIPDTSEFDITGANQVMNNFIDIGIDLISTKSNNRTIPAEIQQIAHDFIAARIKRNQSIGLPGNFSAAGSETHAQAIKIRAKAYQLIKKINSTTGLAFPEENINLKLYDLKILIADSGLRENGEPKRDHLNKIKNLTNDITYQATPYIVAQQSINKSNKKTFVDMIANPFNATSNNPSKEISPLKETAPKDREQSSEITSAVSEILKKAEDRNKNVTTPANTGSTIDIDLPIPKFDYIQDKSSQNKVSKEDLNKIHSEIKFNIPDNDALYGYKHLSSNEYFWQDKVETIVEAIRKINSTMRNNNLTCKQKSKIIKKASKNIIELKNGIEAEIKRRSENFLTAITIKQAEEANSIKVMKGLLIKEEGRGNEFLDNLLVDYKTCDNPKIHSPAKIFGLRHRLANLIESFKPIKIKANKKKTPSEVLPAEIKKFYDTYKKFSLTNRQYKAFQILSEDSFFKHDLLNLSSIDEYLKRTPAHNKEYTKGYIANLKSYINSMVKDLRRAPITENSSALCQLLLNHKRPDLKIKPQDTSVLQAIRKRIREVTHTLKDIISLVRIIDRGGEPDKILFKMEGKVSDNHRKDSNNNIIKLQDETLAICTMTDPYNKSISDKITKECEDNDALRKQFLKREIQTNGDYLEQWTKINKLFYSIYKNTDNNTANKEYIKAFIKNAETKILIASNNNLDKESIEIARTSLASYRKDLFNNKRITDLLSKINHIDYLISNYDGDKHSEMKNSDQTVKTSEPKLDILDITPVTEYEKFHEIISKLKKEYEMNKKNSQYPLKETINNNFNDIINLTRYFLVQLEIYNKEIYDQITKPVETNEEAINIINSFHKDRVLLSNISKEKSEEAVINHETQLVRLNKNFPDMLKKHCHEIFLKLNPSKDETIEIQPKTESLEKHAIKPYSEDTNLLVKKMNNEIDPMFSMLKEFKELHDLQDKINNQKTPERIITGSKKSTTKSIKNTKSKTSAIPPQPLTPKIDGNEITVKETEHPHVNPQVEKRGIEIAKDIIPTPTHDGKNTSKERQKSFFNKIFNLYKSKLSSNFKPNALSTKYRPPIHASQLIENIEFINKKIIPKQQLGESSHQSEDNHIPAPQKTDSGIKM